MRCRRCRNLEEGFVQRITRESLTLIITTVVMPCSLLVCFPITTPAQTAPARPEQPKWTMTWNDEFNSSTIDTTKWVFDIGGGGWGNRELEYYTNRTENASLRDGHLVITARKEKYAGKDAVTWNYTSARLKTLGTFTQTYGRFEARIKVPYGQGIWPAFWMLGEDIQKVGWPQCGEIDIMENIGKEPSVVHGTIHGPGYSGPGGISAAYTLPGKQRFADAFHVFAVEWEPNSIRFYVDGNLFATRTSVDLSPGQKWVFDHPVFLLLNLAVGGDWPGNPDSSTVFPQRLLVDYVRVFRRAAP
jgi:beta-glucanase (GH16 family)